MDVLTAEINKQFKNEFSFLKIIDIVYNKNTKTCIINFLYPQSVSNISPEQSQKILKFLNEKLKLNSK